MMLRLVSGWKLLRPALNVMVVPSVTPAKATRESSFAAKVLAPVGFVASLLAVWAVLAGDGALLVVRAIVGGIGAAERDPGIGDSVDVRVVAGAGVEVHEVGGQDREGQQGDEQGDGERGEEASPATGPGALRLHGSDLALQADEGVVQGDI